MPYYTPFSLRVDSEYIEKLTWIARREHRSTNRQIEFVLAHYLFEYETAHGPIPLRHKSQ